MRSCAILEKLYWISHIPTFALISFRACSTLVFLSTRAQLLRPTDLTQQTSCKWMWLCGNTAGFQPIVRVTTGQQHLFLWAPASYRSQASANSEEPNSSYPHVSQQGEIWDRSSLFFTFSWQRASFVFFFKAQVLVEKGSWVMRGDDAVSPHLCHHQTGSTVCQLWSTLLCSDLSAVWTNSRTCFRLITSLLTK